ncbi:MAG: glycosyltransferase [Xanthomonadales bacterium]|jgi:glycosyltransferase involved in cell wall biosynthesis|nr:glycosyltransferase [Xanthomonadales bacterium]
MDVLVSVVMPVRNGGRYLEPAVDSILSQSHAKLELILVDDNSDDGAIARLPADDGRLRRLSSAGRGVSAAFNTGLAVAGGEYIARMDADDIALPERIEAQLAYLQRHADVSICGGCIEIFSAGGLQGGNLRYQDWLNACRSPGRIRRELFIESPIPNPTAFFRREAILELAGYADPAWPEDYDLFLRADALGMKMGKPDPIVLRWREHPARLTRTDGRYALVAFQQAKIHYLAQNRLPKGRGLIIWGAGPTGKLTHDLLAAGPQDVLGFLEVHPRRIGGKKRGLPVWPIQYLVQDQESFVLVAVGAVGAKGEIRRFMQDLGRVEGENYLFVA